MTTVVVGAGPAGIAVAAGAVSRAEEVILLEASDSLGGLTQTYVQAGHVFSRSGTAWARDISVLRQLAQEITGWRTERAETAVWLASEGKFIPNPLPYHLARLGAVRARRISQEIAALRPIPGRNFDDYLERRYGRELTKLFYRPWWSRATATNLEQLPPPPQPEMLSPKHVMVGARGGDTPRTVETYSYPTHPQGWNGVWAGLVKQAQVRTRTSVRRVEAHSPRETQFSVIAHSVGYSANKVVMACPLDEAMRVTGSIVSGTPMSATVVVVNVGGSPGKALPKWARVRIPDSIAGFHQVDITSNVVPEFAPKGGVTLAVTYVLTGEPDHGVLADHAVKELKEWGWLDSVECCGLRTLRNALPLRTGPRDWAERAITLLEGQGIQLVGQGARWAYQDLTTTVREGLVVGGAIRRGRV